MHALDLQWAGGNLLCLPVAGLLVRLIVDKTPLSNAHNHFLCQDDVYRLSKTLNNSNNNSLFVRLLPILITIVR